MMAPCSLKVMILAAALPQLMVGVAMAQEEPEALTGIYVEFWVPPTGNPCGTNPPAVGDGWFAVPGFPSRGATCPGATPANGLAYGSNVTFTGQSGTTYRIFAVDAAQPIGTITVNGSGFTLLVGRSTNTSPPFINEFVPLASAGGGNIGAISASGGTVQVRSTGAVTSLSAGAVVRMDARNSVGSVFAFGAVGVVQAPSIGTVSAQSVGAVLVTNWDSGPTPQDYAATVSASTGDITRVDVTGARMRGSVLADAGMITTGVSSTVGIGPATGTPSTIRARNGIRSIAAPTINANIDARHSGGAGLIQTLQATAGTFVGSLQAAGIGSTGTGFYTAGNLSASITISGDVLKPFTVVGATIGTVTLAGSINQPVALNGGVIAGAVSVGTLSSTLSIAGSPAAPLSLSTISSGGSALIGGDVPMSTSVTIASGLAGSFTVNGSMGGQLRIAGSLSGTITVGSVGNPGLSGQIVLNAADTGGSWTGGVRVGGSTGLLLSPEGLYPQLSSELGGGAVGLVPFNLHKQDCTPPDGGSIGWPGAYSVTVRHYGPVVIENPASDTTPMTVEWFNPNSQQWEDISGDFTYTRSATNPRDVIVTSLIPNLDFDGTVTYRIRPRITGANRLLCDPGVLAVTNPVPVAGYTYTVVGQEP